MMRQSIALLSAFVAFALWDASEAFSASPFATTNVARASTALSATPSGDDKSKTNPMAALVVGATMAFSLVSGAEPAFATSKTAAQISLNNIPPSTVELSIGDLPVLGNLLSGTYTKVDKSVDKPSVTIKSPADKLTAIKSVATGGHLEFDVNGKLNTHLDVDVATVRPGVAMIRVESPLIPGLPFKNKANTVEVKPKGPRTDWNAVTNLGSGEVMFYTNTKTGESQYDLPAGF